MEAHPTPEPDEVTLGAGFDFTDPSSSLAPLYVRGAHLATAVFLAVVFVYVSLFPVWHTDVWGHLRFGEYIVQQGQLPEHEMFSGDYADQSAPYINFQWLAQAGAYLVFDLGRRVTGPGYEAQLGGGALFLSTALAVIVTLRMFVLVWAFRRLTGSLRTALVGGVLVFAMSMFCHLGITRPQVLGELGFAVLLLALSRPVLTVRAMVLLPLVFLVWANLHGSFLIGFVLLGLFLVGRWVQVVWTSGLRGVWADAQVRRLALVIPLCTAAAAINPHGPALFVHIARLSSHPNIPDLAEWKPLPFNVPPGWVFLGSVALLVPLAWLNRRRWTPTQVLLLLVFGVQTVLHARVFVWWLMVFGWVVAPHLHALAERWRLPVTEDADRLSLRKTIFAAMAVVAVMLWSMPAQWLVWGDKPVGTQRVNPLTPVRASAYLKKQYDEQPDLRRVVFTTETSGEFLLWDLRPEPPVRVFCYTHVHLLTPEHWQEFLRVKNGDSEWEQILDRHCVAFVVIEPEQHTRLAAKLRAARDHWAIVPGMEPLLVARRH
jgi:hypothetical protein